MRAELIPVILSCDDCFVRHAAVVMISIVKNSGRRYRFYVLDCGISEANVRKLKAWDLGGSEIVVVKMEKNAVFERLSGYYPPANFYRVLIPDLFPEMDRAIYLDCDIVVVGDLGDLWDVDLGDKLLGVVYMEPEFVPVGCYDAQKKTLSMPLDKRYFNNGVLLMNVQALRAWHFLERILQFLQIKPVKKPPKLLALNI
jgi:lipopolysaccharide biosynthesis glycosyltransferase